MKEDAHILIVIPARGGSKGVPRKNIRPFAGRPLIARTIRTALSLQGARFRVVVSTDDPEIASVSKLCGAEVPFLRPKRLAQDTSLVADAVLHLLSELKRRENYVPDYIMHLQPPSPLVEPEDIYRCMEALSKNPKADAALTICPTHPLLYHLGKNGALELVNRLRLKKFTAGGRVVGFQRQAFPPAYKLNGCFVYLVKYTAFMREKTFQPKRTVAVVVDAWRSIDIDTPEDFVLAEIIFKNRQRIKRALATFRQES